MFQMTVKKAMKIPGYDYWHIVGTDMKGDTRVGDYITDGKTEYEITAIPLVHKKNIVVGEVDICIRPGNFSIDNLLGKTLYTST